MASPRVRVSAPAKVNLQLRILGRRPDGFHQLQTVMAATTLADELTFEVLPEAAEGTTRLTVSDPSLPSDEGNLVQRAVALVREETGWATPLAVHLRKRIPHGAGLGGGSADAAATLEALNRLGRLGGSREQLAQWGARLGSDVPFFFHGPVALCQGRGERVTAWHEVRGTLALVVLFPRIVLSTKAVYAALDAPRLDEQAAASSERDVPRPEMLFDPDEPLGVRPSALRNDLEAAARRVAPELDAVFAATADISCGWRMLTGSGSAVVFGVEPGLQARVAQEITSRNLGDVFVVHTLDASHANLFDLPVPAAAGPPPLTAPAAAATAGH